MERGEVQSKLRNPTLANLLKDIPGYIERLGSGIKFMLDETKRMGLPAPRIRETSEFVVTFGKAPDLLPPQAHSQSPSEETLWGEYERQQGEVSAQQLPDEQKSRLIKALEYVNEHGFITRLQSDPEQ